MYVSEDIPATTVRVILALSLSLLSEEAVAAAGEGDDILLGTVAGIILKGGLRFILK